MSAYLVTCPEHGTFDRDLIHADEAELLAEMHNALRHRGALIAYVQHEDQTDEGAAA